MFSRYTKKLHESEVAAWKKVAEMALEQVEYLRFQLNARPMSPLPAPFPSPSSALLDTVPMTTAARDEAMSPIEQELHQLYEDGHMDADELSAALQTIQAASLEP